MNSKRKGLWPALALICMAALLGVSALWNTLAGQGCFKITAETGDALSQRLSALQTAEGMELGAFSLKNLQTGTLAPATLYESVLFHPVALGLSMAEGDMSFRTDAEHQILLHTKTAARLIPTGQCVGATVKTEAGQFQVAGLYKGTGLWKNEASAVVSAGESGLRPVYVWMRTASDDVFAYERLRRALTEENQGTDAASFAGVDLTKRGASAQIANAVALFLMALMLAKRFWRDQAGMRQKLIQTARENFQKRYFFGAGIRCIWPFVRYLGVSLLCGGALIAGALLLRQVFSQGAADRPEQLLSLRAWGDYFGRESAAIRSMYELPMAACRTGALLQGLGLGLGIAGLATAGLALGGKTKKERAKG